MVQLLSTTTLVPIKHPSPIVVFSRTRKLCPVLVFLPNLAVEYTDPGLMIDPAPISHPAISLDSFSNSFE